jgi:hypothetical protein
MRQTTAALGRWLLSLRGPWRHLDASQRRCAAYELWLDHLFEEASTVGRDAGLDRATMQRMLAAHWREPH